jgi:hypothetical protein
MERYLLSLPLLVYLALSVIFTKFGNQLWTLKKKFGNFMHPSNLYFLFLSFQSFTNLTQQKIMQRNLPKKACHSPECRVGFTLIFCERCFNCIWLLVLLQFWAQQTQWPGAEGTGALWLRMLKQAKLARRSSSADCNTRTLLYDEVAA